jgi:hypothetical protein
MSSQDHLDPQRDRHVTIEKKGVRRQLGTADWLFIDGLNTKGVMEAKKFWVLKSEMIDDVIESMYGLYPG